MIVVRFIFNLYRVEEIMNAQKFEKRDADVEVTFSNQRC